MKEPTLNVENAVRDRYSEAAHRPSEKLCCPIDYDPRFLEAIPDEVLERDYGCGDPSRHLREGETVLDLGSGGGKICFIASQVVGAKGRVVGVDMNDEMLALANRHRPEVARRIGYDNVEFRKGRIQDLALDYGKLEERLAAHPLRSATELAELEEWSERMREREPMIADESIDVIVSNCVLNLVRPAHKKRLFTEMHRVLRIGGRAVISDIVADEEVPQAMQNDAELWSGCISGAYREDRFLEAFAEAGFQGMRIVARDREPWQVVRGIEFRSITVEAFRVDTGVCLERRQAVVYLGPWSEVRDDDGHVLERGVRTAVCDRTYRTLNAEPYGAQIEGIQPHEAVSLEEARTFDCSRDRVREAAETKDGSTVRDSGPRGGSCC